MKKVFWPLLFVNLSYLFISLNRFVFNFDIGFHNSFYFLIFFPWVANLLVIYIYRVFEEGVGWAIILSLFSWVAVYEIWNWILHSGIIHFGLEF